MYIFFLFVVKSVEVMKNNIGILMKIWKYDYCVLGNFYDVMKWCVG